jgi:hypothetical protein
MDNHDMLTMKAGDKFACIMSIRFPPFTTARGIDLLVTTVMRNFAGAQLAVAGPTEQWRQSL